MKNNAQLKHVRSYTASLPEARLKVVQGPYKGVSYKIVSAKVIIGREKSCDIQLTKDKKCSRQQAVILFKSKGYYIKDLSGKASLKVNSVRKIQSRLQDGDLIKCGTSILQFECKELKSMVPVLSQRQGQKVKVPIPIPPAGTPVASKSVHAEELKAPVPFSSQGALLTAQQDSPVQQSIQQPGLSPHPAVSKKRSTGKKSQLPRILIGALVVLFLVLLLSEDKKLKPQEDKLRTAESIEEDVKSLTELKEQEMEKKKRNMEVSFKDAQAAYINGIRDYRKGVYVRAIEAFRVCKTLYPQHELCGTYLQKAQNKKQQLIQAWMLDGKDARAKGRFEACLGAFKNVMLAVRDKSNLTYKEALGNYDICKIKFEGRY